MSRFLNYLDEKCKKKDKKEKIDEESINESNYNSKFTEDKALWNVIKKYWSKETMKLEKDGYDQKIWNDLKDNIVGSIQRYGMGIVDQSTKKIYHK